MALDFSFWAVLSAGFISFLSPCVLPLVPPYLCYMSGVRLEDLRYEGQEKRKSWIRFRLFLSSFCFSLGFSTIFIALGASASSIGRFLNLYHTIFGFIAGAIIMLMGFNFLGVFRLLLFNQERRFFKINTKFSLSGAYIMGLAFAFGWTPCIGPILGPILTLAGSKQTVLEGSFLLAFYSLGLAIPFLLAALFSNIFLIFFKKIRQHLGIIEKIIGICLIITGLLFMTGQMEIIAYWLLDFFPALSAL